MLRTLDHWHHDCDDRPLRQVGEMLAQKHNVYYLAFVTGRYDLIAIIMSKTPEELSHFIKEHISSMPSILRTETFVNLEIIKSPWIGTLDIFQPVDGLGNAL